MGQRALPRRLPSAQARLLHDVADVLGFRELVLYGGAALDLLAEPSPTPHDLDVAILGGAEAEQRISRLKERPGIVDVSAPRRYWIRLHQPVVMADVRWQDRIIDLNFVQTLNGIGHFDVECLTWHYPSATYSDPYGVLDLLPVGDARLVSSLRSENPVLLLNRAIKLAAKYDIALDEPGQLSSVIPDLVDAARRWASEDDFHGRQALHAHARALASATHRAAEPARFLRQCLSAGVLDCRHPVLGDVLRRDDQAIQRLAGARSFDEFWHQAAILEGRQPASDTSQSGGWL